jgi:hypothetical protein
VREIATEVGLAQAIGVPIAGICLYPILDRPDWHDADHWHHWWLWEVLPDPSGHLQRVLVEDYAGAFTAACNLLDEVRAEQAYEDHPCGRMASRLSWSIGLLLSIHVALSIS